MGLVAIGLRNVRRNPRRSALSITALAVGVAVMIIGMGWIRGYYSTIYGGVRKLETGDLQVLRNGYLDQERRLPLDLAISDSQSMVRSLAGNPLVKAGHRLQCLFIASIETGHPLSPAASTELENRFHSACSMSPLSPATQVPFW